MLLAEQLVRQRFVHPGPLVLGTNPLKHLAPVVDRRPTCLTLSVSSITKGVGLYHHPDFDRETDV